MTASDQPDLWQFWQQTKAELAQVPLEPQVEPLPEYSTAHIPAYRVTLASLGGVRVTGLYAHPTLEPGRKFPALLTTPGYGGAVCPPIEEAAFGYACLAIDPRGQGQSAAAYPMERGKLTHHPEDLWSCGLRGVLADVLRGLDFLATRDEIDAARLGLMGTSGGGGLTLACGGIDDRVAAASAHVPFLCRLVWAAENVATHPFREAGEYLEQHPEWRERILANYRYFDPLELVERLTCPTIVGVGMKDQVCPASTIIPAFERIAGTKALVVYPELEHAHSADFHRHNWDWLANYLRP